MYLKKKLIFLSAVVAFLIFVSCETSTNYQNSSNVLNKPIKVDTQTKINSNISLETEENKVIGQNKTLKIGLILPLTGKHYQMGQSLLNSAQLALAKTENKKIVFHLVDSGNEEKILTELYGLLEKDIDIFIGPVFSNKVRKIKEVIKNKNIPLISLSNNSELTDKGVYVFGLTLEDEISELLNFSYKNNLKKYAVILPENKFGIRVKNELNKFKSDDALLTFKFTFYDTDSPDFYTVAKNISNYEERKTNLENKIKFLEKENSEKASKELKKLNKLDTYGELNFEAIIIFAQNFQEVSNFSTILPYYDVDPKKIQFIGNSIWFKSQALKEPGLINGYFSALNIKKRKMFEDSYIDTFGLKPHTLSTLTYDLVGLLSKLQSEKSNFTINMLHTTQGFIGVDGWFKIFPDGKVLRKPRIYKINNQNFTLLN